MAKQRKPRGDSGIWVLMERDMEEGEEIVLGLFDEESPAVETRDYCQAQFVDEEEAAAYYTVECVPIRLQRMSLDSILRRTQFTDVFEKNKRSN